MRQLGERWPLNDLPRRAWNRAIVRLARVGGEREAPFRLTCCGKAFALLRLRPAN